MPRSQTPFPLSALSVLVRTCAHVVLPLPTLVAGRAYVELLRDRAHLETSGPSSSARPPPPRRNRQGRRSRPTIGYDRGGSPAPTRGAALAGLVRLPTQQAPLRYGNPCSARGARCHCARSLAFGTGSSTRLLPRDRLDTRTHLPSCDNRATTPEAPGGPRCLPPVHAVAALASPAALAAAPRVPHHPRVVQQPAYRARGPPGPRASPATPAAAAQVAATPASPAALDVPPPCAAI